MPKSFAIVGFVLSLTACGSKAQPAGTPGAPSSEPAPAPSPEPPASAPSSSAEPPPAPPPSPAASSAPSAGGAGCKDKDGKMHAVGTKWNDGCNVCSCGREGASCTRRICN